MRKLFQCNGCRHQTSLTAGSLMEHSKLPLTTWFLAIHLISQAKTGLSALALKRDLGVSYPTAWLLLHKINHAMARQDDMHRLCGAVQLDDAYLGGERTGGKAGRGSENKEPFVAAVSLNERGHPLHLKLNPVSGFTLEAIGRWAKAHRACDIFDRGSADFPAGLISLRQRSAQQDVWPGAFALGFAVSSRRRMVERGRHAMIHRGSVRADQDTQHG